MKAIRPTLAVAVAAGMFAARVDGVSVSGVSATQGADRTMNQYNNK